MHNLFTCGIPISLALLVLQVLTKRPNPSAAVPTDLTGDKKCSICWIEVLISLLCLLLQVLNAKPENVERESEIVAQSGRKGAVTISTNMAGRGVYWDHSSSMQA